MGEIEMKTTLEKLFYQTEEGKIFIEKTRTIEGFFLNLLVIVLLTPLTQQMLTSIPVRIGLLLLFYYLLHRIKKKS